MSSAQNAARSIEDLQQELNTLDKRYLIEKVIGSGSYGIVVRARDTSDNDSLVAIKRVNKEIFDEVILAKRILREIKLLAHFHDVNIVGLRNILTPKTENFHSFFIVMDIMETDVRAVLKSGQKLSDSHIQFFLYQGLRALKVIHAAGVIHRDVTPANVLVNTNCDLKICDFGLAKEEADNGDDMTDYVTMRWYRAPELVMEHKKYTGKVDVWGFGLILGELLGSRPLCQGRDRVLQLNRIIEVIGTPPEEDILAVGSPAAQKYLRKQQYRPPMDFQAKYPNATPESLDLLRKMLVFNPEKRISVDDALKHPYFAQLYEEADSNITVPPFTFDESKHVTVDDVRHGIYQESINFHIRHPKTFATQQAARAALEHTGDEGRSMESTINKSQVDEGNYHTHTGDQPDANEAQ